MGYLMALFQSNSPPLIAVEEPEATIHPGALESLLEMLLTASADVQVVMTTHSPELLDAKWITDRHLRMVDWRDGATHVGSVSGANRAALQQHLMGAGELLRAKTCIIHEGPDSTAKGRDRRRNGSRTSLPASGAGV